MYTIQYRSVFFDRIDRVDVMINGVIRVRPPPPKAQSRISPMGKFYAKVTLPP